MHQYHLPGSPGSSFVTLTYDPAKLPADNSLSKEVLQTFVRDLRYRTGKAVKVRYLGCGEYGTRKGRAHYHLLVFGFSFPDRVKWQKTRQGHQLYRSELLELVWPHGFALVGDVTFESARYVGGYAMKKIGGERAEEHYRRQSPVDGDWYQVEPEFQLMSLKPGIGESWFRMFKSDVFPSDECIIGGRKLKPPRYYEKMLSEAELGPIKRARKRRAFVKKEDRTPKRLAVREEIAHLRQERLQREVE